MQDTAKYLVHADITANGVVERSDVVGAVFGQTEGLLGDELDLRELQDSSKVGRIDVEIDSENGQSFGRITIATSLDQVETAILGAALETIDRVGPCRATIEVRKIEDVRAAKRREVIERAKTLLGEAFDESMRSSRDLVEEVREAVRIEDITEYEGLPAGPRVADSDAIVIVEGRADVLTLLQYGIKNAIAVEGTNVPDVVANLTEERTVTAFLDGDRGGELILKELQQVGDVDYVAFAPENRSVEDLARHEVMAALRGKVPYERVSDSEHPSDVRPRPPDAAEPDGSDVSTEKPAAVGADTSDADAAEEPAVPDELADSAGADDRDGTKEKPAAEELTPVEETTGPSNGAAAGGAETGATADGVETVKADSEAADSEASEESLDEESPDAEEPPRTLRGHVRAVVGEGTKTARSLDEEFEILAETDADSAFDLIADGEETPAAVVIDGELSQRILDVAAQRGIGQIIAASTGEFVKKPTSVRVRTAGQLLATNEA